MQWKGEWLARGARSLLTGLAGVLLCGLYSAAPVQALDFTPHGTQPPLKTSLENSGSCQGCHRGFGAPHNALMPHSTWSGSMMANATRDPLFWAALDVANKDLPGVGDYCLRCHTPNGWLGGRVAKNGGAGQPANGAMGCQLQGDYNDDDGSGNDYSGIGCHFCHRVMPHGPQGPQSQPFAIGNGNIWVDDDSLCPAPNGQFYGGPCRRGPYTYVNFELEPPHGWQPSALHSSSEFCGTCHDVSTPDTDQGPLKTLVLENGTTTTRPFPIERTYSEWKRSLFADLIFRDGLQNAAVGVLPALAKGQTCQNCHMPNTDDPLAQACSMNPEGSRTGNLPTHRLVGANTWIPAMIKTLYAGASGFNRASDFDRTIAWARAMLQASAKVTATITAFTAPAPGAPGQVSVRVRTTNLSGHKLPTGYSEGRRMWLNLKVFNATNGLVAESGAFDATTGVLTEDSQIKIYEVLQGIWDPALPGTCRTEAAGKKVFHFVLNNCIAKDNRIPPLGFRPAAPGDANGDEVRPVNYSYPEVTPGELANYDDTVYSFVLPAGTPLPVRVEANLRHQIASKDYIEFLRDQAVAAPAVPAENTLCAGAPGRPFTVGPQSLSRGEFMHALWSDPAYGKSPPETAASATVVTGK